MTTSTASTIETEKDSDLLVIMTMKEDEPLAAHQAFTTFYNRYKEDVYKLIYKVCGHHANADELASILFNNTFNNAYTYAASFSIKEDVINERPLLLSWLLTIAKREFLRLITRKKEVETIALEDVTQEFESADVPYEETEATYGEVTVQKALSILTPREKDVLLTYIEY